MIVKLELTLTEARGLLSFAQEGSDDEAAREFNRMHGMRWKTANRGIVKLRAATHDRWENYVRRSTVRSNAWRARNGFPPYPAEEE